MKLGRRKWSVVAARGPHYGRLVDPTAFPNAERRDVDVKNKSVIASDKRLNSVLTFYLPEIF